VKKEIIRVLLTGPQRVGTTFFGNLLNSNENCVFLRDSFVPIFRISRRLGIKSFTEVLPIRSRNIILFTLKSELMIRGITNLSNLQSNQFITLEELFDLAMGTFVNDSTRVFGVKITEEEGWFETLLKETDMKMIYLIRDLRDVLFSSANAFANYDRNYYAKRWFQGITEALRINDPRMIIVKFEDLILNPEKELERLSGFLGIPLIADIKELRDVSGADWVDNSSFHDVKKLFDTTSVYRWKKNLNSKEVEYGSIVYKKLMKELGYEENKLPFFKGLKIRIIRFKELTMGIIRSLFFFRLGRKMVWKIIDIIGSLRKDSSITKEQVLESLAKAGVRVSFKHLLRELKIIEREEMQELFVLLETLKQEKKLTIRYVILCSECGCELLSRKNLSQGLLDKKVYCNHCREINVLHPQVTETVTMIYPVFEQLKEESG